jgi:hypothetical protein
MKTFACRLWEVSPAMLLVALLLITSGCATQKIDWNARVGNYTYDQAVIDNGPPDKYARLKDGTIVAEWLTSRGYNQAYVMPAYHGYHCYGPVFPTVVNTSSPDYFLRLSFDPDGKLKTWKTFFR